jgi:DNA-binding NarL/FixJ family response regulator
MEPQRRRLARIIEAADDLELVGLAEGGYQAVFLCSEHRPDVVLMDIEMEHPLAGVDASREIHTRLPKTRIVVLTAHDDEKIIFAAFQAGIVDFLVKTAEPRKITEAVRSAMANSSPIRPMIAEKIRGEFARVRESEERLLYTVRIIATLTPSELSILRLLDQGLKRSQIAEQRCIAVSTVKTHVNSLLRKFDAKSTTEVLNEVRRFSIFEIIDQLESAPRLTIGGGEG